jgi:hypothetical protein
MAYYQFKTPVAVPVIKVGSGPDMNAVSDAINVNSSTTFASAKAVNTVNTSVTTLATQVAALAQTAVKYTQTFGATDFFADVAGWKQIVIAAAAHGVTVMPPLVNVYDSTGAAVMVNTSFDPATKNVTIAVMEGYEFDGTMSIS